MSSNPNTELPTEQIETMDLATAQRVEQEKMTRRAALRKLGFGAGMAAFALLGVDDFARMVGKRMERTARDNKVAEQVAKEFQNAGIVMADTPQPYYSSACKACEQHYQDCINCTSNPNYAALGTSLTQCLNKNCPGGSTGSAPPPANCTGFKNSYCV